MTVYAVYYDMESDLPDAYVIDEDVAKMLTDGSDVADYTALEVSEQEWMALLTGKTAWAIATEKVKQ